MLVTSDKPGLENRMDSAAKAIMVNAIDAQQNYIRKQFDAAFTDSTALGAIKVAEMLGYTEMAEEMKADYFTETGKEVA